MKQSKEEPRRKKFLYKPFVLILGYFDGEQIFTSINTSAACRNSQHRVIGRAGLEHKQKPIEFSLKHAFLPRMKEYFSTKFCFCGITLTLHDFERVSPEEL